MLTGLPGCGKSHVSEMLTDVVGRTPICLDELREERFPLARLGREVKYATETTGFLYRLVHARARSQLETGRSAILDGTFLVSGGRAETADVALEIGGEVLFIKVTAPEGVILERLARRQVGADHKSDAGIEVYRMMAGRIASGESGYSDPELDRRQGSCPGELVVVDTHARTVRVTALTRLSLAVAHGLAALGFSLQGPA